jgi:hypothetical protein
MTSSTAVAASALLSLSMPPSMSSESQEAQEEERSDRRSNDDNAQDGKIFQDHQTEHQNREHLVKEEHLECSQEPKTETDLSVCVESTAESKKEVISFLVQDADGIEDSINWSNAGVVVDFEGPYAESLKNIEVGNVIEVTKFITIESQGGSYSGSGNITYSRQQSSSTSRETKNPSFDPIKIEVIDVEEDSLKTSINILPLKVVVRVPNPEDRVQSPSSSEASTITPASQPSQVLPIVSIKKKYSFLDNPLLLKVDIFGKKPEKPSPGLRFTSKVLRPDEIPAKAVDLSIVKEEPKEDISRPARMMTRRSCSSSSSTSPLSSPIMSSRYSGSKTKTRRVQHQV